MAVRAAPGCLRIREVRPRHQGTQNNICALREGFSGSDIKYIYGDRAAPDAKRMVPPPRPALTTDRRTCFRGRRRSGGTRRQGRFLARSYIFYHPVG